MSRSRIAPITVTIVALLLYLRTLMPDMAFGDWGEMQTVPHVLGIAHPTGYPTYILTAWLFELLPIGSIAFRANLLSAVCVAVTLGTLTAIAQRVGVRPAIAAVAALATGAVGTVWAAAAVAEVNPLHLVLMALLIHRALVWSNRRSPVDLALGGLLIGIALGNHLLTLFVAPYVVLFVLWTGRRAFAAKPLWLLIPVVTVAAGAAVYLYIPIAANLNPVLAYNHPTTLDGVRWLVTGEQFRGQYGGLLTPDSLGPFTASLPALWDIAGSRATPLFGIVGAIGLLVLLVRRPAFGLLCTAILVTGIYVWANYLELEHYLLVPWLLTGIGVAVALEGVAALIERAAPEPARRWVGPATAAVGAVLAVALVVINLPASDRSGDRTAETYVDQVLTALPENAAILSFWDASTPLWHAQDVEGRRPDVLIVDDSNIVYEGWGTREDRIASLICSRPVYTLRLSDDDLAPTTARWRIEPLTTVHVGAGGPSASITRTIYRVLPSADSCP